MTTDESRSFRVIKLDDTSAWREDIVAACGPLFSVYIFDDTERTHLCEATPSRALYYVGTTWDGSSAWSTLSEEQREALMETIREADYDCEPVTYMHCSRADALPHRTIEADDIDAALEYAQGNGYAG